MEEKQSSRALFIGAVIAVLAVAGIVVFLLSNQQAKAPTSDQNQAETPTGSTERDNEVAPNPSERMTITYTNAGFEPATMTVEKGTVITIKNESSRDVQFASDDHPAHRDNPEMNIPTLSPGESESYTATTTGTWSYHNHLDEDETGTITVTEAE